MDILHFSGILLLAGLVSVSSQFTCPCSCDTCENGQCTKGLIDPFSVRLFKTKYPKKYNISNNGKTDYEKDSILEAKYKLARKLLARHLKNLSSLTELQNVAYGYPQESANYQPVISSDQSMILDQQQPVLKVQTPCDLLRSITASALAQSSNYRTNAINRMANQRLQQSVFQTSGYLS